MIMDWLRPIIAFFLTIAVVISLFITSLLLIQDNYDAATAWGVTAILNLLLLNNVLYGKGRE